VDNWIAGAYYSGILDSDVLKGQYRLVGKNLLHPCVIVSFCHSLAGQ
jgi:hypothetical protein